MKDSVFQKRFERKRQNHQVHGQQLTVFNLEHQFLYPIDSGAESELERCKGQVSKGLYRQMKKSLVGFSADMQMEIVDCLRDCVDGFALCTTGIKHVDRVLWSLYRKIQREMADGVNN